MAAAAGIVVLSIDFRNAPEAPYPASLQDINYGIRWLKAHAREFGSGADRVGAYGTSSGGHQVLSPIRVFQTGAGSFLGSCDADHRQMNAGPESPPSPATSITTITIRMIRL